VYMYLLLLTIYSSSIGAVSRDRRPSDKVTAQRKFSFQYIKGRSCQLSTGEAEREKEKRKADKEERHTIRKKMVIQKAKQQAGMPTDSEDDFEERPKPVVRIFILIQITY
jgi:hypothetical protein